MKHIKHDEYPNICSRQDYLVVARCLGQEFIMQRLEQRDTTKIEGTVQRIMLLFSLDNERFDRVRFMEALYASSKPEVR